MRYLYDIKVGKNVAEDVKKALLSLAIELLKKGEFVKLETVSEILAELQEQIDEEEESHGKLI